MLNLNCFLPTSFPPRTLKIEQAEVASMNAQRLIMLSIGQNTTENTTLDNNSNLKAKSRQIAKQVMGLSEKLTQIDRIAGVVSQLANQTNMLALNAAVEAVRAGENGNIFLKLYLITNCILL